MSSATQPAIQLPSAETSNILTVTRGLPPVPIRETYYSDLVEEGFTDSWTAEAAEEEAYHCQPLSVVCHKCWRYEHGTHASLDDAGWTLCKAGELCPDCTQEQINKGKRPEDYWGPVVFTDLPF